MIEGTYTLKASADLGDYPEGDDTEITLLYSDVDTIEECLEDIETANKVRTEGFVAGLKDKMDTKAGYKMLEELDIFVKKFNSECKPEDVLTEPDNFEEFIDTLSLSEWIVWIDKQANIQVVILGS